MEDLCLPSPTDHPHLWEIATFGLCPICLNATPSGEDFTAEERDINSQTENATPDGEDEVPPPIPWATHPLGDFAHFLDAAGERGINTFTSLPVGVEKAAEKRDINIDTSAGSKASMGGVNDPLFSNQSLDGAPACTYIAGGEGNTLPQMETLPPASMGSLKDEKEERIAPASSSNEICVTAEKRNKNIIKNSSLTSEAMCSLDEHIQLYKSGWCDHSCGVFVKCSTPLIGGDCHIAYCEACQHNELVAKFVALQEAREEINYLQKYTSVPHHSLDEVAFYKRRNTEKLRRRELLKRRWEVFHAQPSCGMVSAVQDFLGLSIPSYAFWENKNENKKFFDEKFLNQRKNQVRANAIIPAITLSAPDSEEEQILKPSVVVASRYDFATFVALKSKKAAAQRAVNKKSLEPVTLVEGGVKHFPVKNESGDVTSIITADLPSICITRREAEKLTAKKDEKEEIAGDAISRIYTKNANNPLLAGKLVREHKLFKVEHNIAQLKNFDHLSERQYQQLLSMENRAEMLKKQIADISAKINSRLAKEAIQKKKVSAALARKAEKESRLALKNKIDIALGRKTSPKLEEANKRMDELYAQIKSIPLKVTRLTLKPIKIVKSFNALTEEHLADESFGQAKFVFKKIRQQNVKVEKDLAAIAARKAAAQAFFERRLDRKRQLFQVQEQRKSAVFYKNRPHGTNTSSPQTTQNCRGTSCAATFEFISKVFFIHFLYIICKKLFISSSNLFCSTKICYKNVKRYNRFIVNKSLCKYSCTNYHLLFHNCKYSCLFVNLFSQSYDQWHHGVEHHDVTGPPASQMKGRTGCDDDTNHNHFIYRQNESPQFSSAQRYSRRKERQLKRGHNHLSSPRFTKSLELTSSPKTPLIQYYASQEGSNLNEGTSSFITSSPSHDLSHRCTPGGLFCQPEKSASVLTSWGGEWKRSLTYNRNHYAHTRGVCSCSIIIANLFKDRAYFDKCGNCCFCDKSFAHHNYLNHIFKCKEFVNSFKPHCDIYKNSSSFCDVPYSKKCYKEINKNIKLLVRTNIILNSVEYDSGYNSNEEHTAFEPKKKTTNEAITEEIRQYYIESRKLEGTRCEDKKLVHVDNKGELKVKESRFEKMRVRKLRAQIIKCARDNYMDNISKAVNQIKDFESLRSWFDKYMTSKRRSVNYIINEDLENIYLCLSDLIKRCSYSLRNRFDNVNFDSSKFVSNAYFFNESFTISTNISFMSKGSFVLPAHIFKNRPNGKFVICDINTMRTWGPFEKSNEESVFNDIIAYGEIVDNSVIDDLKLDAYYEGMGYIEVPNNKKFYSGLVEEDTGCMHGKVIKLNDKTYMCSPIPVSEEYAQREGLVSLHDDKIDVIYTSKCMKCGNYASHCICIKELVKGTHYDKLNCVRCEKPVTECNCCHKLMYKQATICEYNVENSGDPNECNYLNHFECRYSEAMHDFKTRSDTDIFDVTRDESNVLMINAQSRKNKAICVINFQPTGFCFPTHLLSASTKYYFLNIYKDNKTNHVSGPYTFSDNDLIDDYHVVGAFEISCFGQMSQKSITKFLHHSCKSVRLTYKDIENKTSGTFVCEGIMMTRHVPIGSRNIAMFTPYTAVSRNEFTIVPFNEGIVWTSQRGGRMNFAGSRGYNARSNRGVPSSRGYYQNAPTQTQYFADSGFQQPSTSRGSRGSVNSRGRSRGRIGALPIRIPGLTAATPKVAVVTKAKVETETKTKDVANHEFVVKNEKFFKVETIVSTVSKKQFEASPEVKVINLPGAKVSKDVTNKLTKNAEAASKTMFGLTGTIQTIICITLVFFLFDAGTALPTEQPREINCASIILNLRTMNADATLTISPRGIIALQELSSLLQSSHPKHSCKDDFNMLTTLISRTRTQTINEGSTYDIGDNTDCLQYIKNCNTTKPKNFVFITFEGFNISIPADHQLKWLNTHDQQAIANSISQHIASKHSIWCLGDKHLVRHIFYIATQYNIDLSCNHMHENCRQFCVIDFNTEKVINNKTYYVRSDCSYQFSNGAKSDLCNQCSDYQKSLLEYEVKWYFQYYLDNLSDGSAICSQQSKKIVDAIRQRIAKQNLIDCKYNSLGCKAINYVQLSTMYNYGDYQLFSCIEINHLISEFQLTIRNFTDRLFNCKLMNYVFKSKNAETGSYGKVKVVRWPHIYMDKGPYAMCTNTIEKSFKLCCSKNLQMKIGNQLLNPGCNVVDIKKTVEIDMQQAGKVFFTHPTDNYHDSLCVRGSTLISEDGSVILSLTDEMRKIKNPDVRIFDNSITLTCESRSWCYTEKFVGKIEMPPKFIICENTLEGQSYAITAFATSTGNDALQHLSRLWDDPIGYLFNVQDGNKYKFYGVKIMNSFTRFTMQDILFLTVMIIMWMTPARVYVWLVFVAYLASKVATAIAIDCDTVNTESIFKISGGTVLFATEHISTSGCFRITLVDNSGKTLSSYNMRVNDIFYDVKLESAFYVPVEYQIDREHTWGCPGTGNEKCSVKSSFNRDAVGVVVRKSQYENGLIDGCFLIGEAHICEVFMLQKLSKPQSMSCYKLEDVSDRNIEMSFVEDNVINGSSKQNIVTIKSDEWTTIDSKLSLKLTLDNVNKYIVYNYVCFDFTSKKMYYTDRTPIRTGVITSFVIDTIPKSGEANLPRDYIDVKKLSIKEVEWTYVKNNKEKFLEQSYFEEVSDNNNRFTYKLENGHVNELHYHPKDDEVKIEFKTSNNFVTTLSSTCTIDSCKVNSVIDLQVVAGNYQHRLNIKCDGYSSNYNKTMAKFTLCRVDKGILCYEKEDSILTCNPTVACPYNVETFSFYVCGKPFAEKINSTFTIVDSVRVRLNYATDTVSKFSTYVSGKLNFILSLIGTSKFMYIISTLIIGFILSVLVNNVIAFMFCVLTICIIQTFALELIDDHPLFSDDLYRKFVDDVYCFVDIKWLILNIVRLINIHLMCFYIVYFCNEGMDGVPTITALCVMSLNNAVLFTTKWATPIKLLINNCIFHLTRITIQSETLLRQYCLNIIFRGITVTGLPMLITFVVLYLGVISDIKMLIISICFALTKNNFKISLNLSTTIAIVTLLTELGLGSATQLRCLYVAGSNVGNRINNIIYDNNLKFKPCVALSQGVEFNSDSLMTIQNNIATGHDYSEACSVDYMQNLYKENGMPSYRYFYDLYECENMSIKKSEIYIVDKATCLYSNNDIIISFSNVVDFGFYPGTVYSHEIGGYCGFLNERNSHTVYFMTWLLMKFVGDRSIHFGDLLIFSSFMFNVVLADTCIWTYGVNHGKRDNQFLYDKGIVASLHGRWNLNITSDKPCISYDAFVTKFNNSKLQTFMYSTKSSDYPGNCCKSQYHEYTKHFCSRNYLSYETFYNMSMECATTIGINDVYDCQYCKPCAKNLALQSQGLDHINVETDCKPGVSWFLAKACDAALCYTMFRYRNRLNNTLFILLVLFVMVSGADASTIRVYTTGTWLRSSIVYVNIAAGALVLTSIGLSDTINRIVHMNNPGIIRRKVTKLTKVLVKGYSMDKHCRRLGMSKINFMDYLDKKKALAPFIAEQSRHFMENSIGARRLTGAHATAIRICDPIYNLGESSRFNKLDIKTRMNYIMTEYKNMQKETDCDLIKKRVDINYSTIDTLKIAFGAVPRVNVVMEHLPHIVRISHVGRKKYGFIDTSVDNNNRTLVTTAHAGGDRDIITRSIVITNDSVAHGDQLCKIKLNYIDSLHDISYYGGPKTKFCTPELGIRYIVIVPHVSNYRGGEGGFFYLEYSKCEIKDKEDVIKTCWRFWDPIVGYYNPTCRQVQGFSGLPIMDEEGRIYGICSTFITTKNESMYATYQHHIPAEVAPDVNCKQTAYSISKMIPGTMNSICMPTGSGKTTNLPFMMYKDYPRRAGESTANVLVLIPNVCPIENTVPYMQSKYKTNEIYKKNSLGDTRQSETRGITYMSYGSWIREKDLAVKVKHFDYIFFDEYHQMDCDVLTAFMLYNRIIETWDEQPEIKNMNSGHLPTFVCMTATPPADTPDSINRNKMITSHRLVNAPPIQTEFAPECKGKKILDPNKDCYNIYGIPVTPELFKDGLNHLFYLPAKSDCDRLKNWLKVKKPGMYIEVFYRGCDTSPQELERTLLSNNTGAIIIATNYIETGVTFDFDVCFDTRNRFTPAINWDDVRRQFVRTMDKVPITPASAQQRAGRVGRFKTGTYYYVSDCQESNMCINLEDIFEAMILFKELTGVKVANRYIWEPFQQYINQEYITFFSDLLDHPAIKKEDQKIIYDILYNPQNANTKNLIPNWVKYANLITGTAHRDFAKAYMPVPTKFVTNSGQGKLQAVHCDEFEKWDGKISRDLGYRMRMDKLQAQVKQKYGNDVYRAISEMEIKTQNSLHAQCEEWLNDPDVPETHKRNIKIMMFPFADVDNLGKGEVNPQDLQSAVHSNDAWLLLFGCAGVSISAYAINNFLHRALPSIVSCYVIDLDVSLDNSNHWDWCAGSDIFNYFSNEVHSIKPFSSEAKIIEVKQYLEYKDELSADEIKKQLELLNSINPTVKEVNYENELNRVATETVAEMKENGAMTKDEKISEMANLVTQLSEIRSLNEASQQTIEFLTAKQNQGERLTDDEVQALHQETIFTEVYTEQIRGLEDTIKEVSRSQIIPKGTDNINIPADIDDLKKTAFNMKAVIKEANELNNSVGISRVKIPTSHSELDLIKQKMVEGISKLPEYAGNAYVEAKNYANKVINSFSEFLNQSQFDAQMQGCVSALGFTSISVFYDHFRSTIGFFPIAIIMIALSSYASICLGFIKTAIIMLGSLFLYSVTTKEGNNAHGGEVFLFGQLPNLCIWIYQAYISGNIPIVDSAISYVTDYLKSTDPSYTLSTVGTAAGITTFLNKAGSWLNGSSSTAVLTNAISVHKIMMSLYEGNYDVETIWRSLTVVTSGMLGNFGIMFRGVLIGFIVSIINIVLVSKGHLFNIIIKLFCKNVVMQDIQTELEKPEVIKNIITFLLYSLEIILDPIQLILILFSYIGIKIRKEDEQTFAKIVSENAGLNMVVWIVKEARKYTKWIKMSGNITKDYAVKTQTSTAFCIDDFSTKIWTIYNSVAAFMSEVPAVYISRSLKWLKNFINSSIHRFKQWLDYNMRSITSKIKSNILSPFVSSMVGCNYRTLCQDIVTGDIVLDLGQNEFDNFINDISELQWNFSCNCGEQMSGRAKQMFAEEIDDYAYKFEGSMFRTCKRTDYTIKATSIKELMRELPDGTVMKIATNSEGVYICQKKESTCVSWLNALLKGKEHQSHILQQWPEELQIKIEHIAETSIEAGSTNEIRAQRLAAIFAYFTEDDNTKCELIRFIYTCPFCTDKRMFHVIDIDNREFFLRSIKVRSGGCGCLQTNVDNIVYLSECSQNNCTIATYDSINDAPKCVFGKCYSSAALEWIRSDWNTFPCILLTDTPQTVIFSTQYNNKETLIPCVDGIEHSGFMTFNTSDDRYWLKLCQLNASVNLMLSIYQFKDITRSWTQNSYYSFDCDQVVSFCHEISVKKNTVEIPVLICKINDCLTMVNKEYGTNNVVGTVDSCFNDIKCGYSMNVIKLKNTLQSGRKISQQQWVSIYQQLRGTKEGEAIIKASFPGGLKNLDAHIEKFSSENYEMNTEWHEFLCNPCSMLYELAVKLKCYNKMSDKMKNNVTFVQDDSFNRDNTTIVSWMIQQGYNAASYVIDGSNRIVMKIKNCEYENVCADITSRFNLFACKITGNTKNEEEFCEYIMMPMEYENVETISEISPDEISLIGSEKFFEAIEPEPENKEVDCFKSRLQRVIGETGRIASNLIWYNDAEKQKWEDMKAKIEKIQKGTNDKVSKIKEGIAVTVSEIKKDIMEIAEGMEVNEVLQWPELVSTEKTRDFAETMTNADRAVLERFNYAFSTNFGTIYQAANFVMYYILSGYKEVNPDFITQTLLYKPSDIIPESHSKELLQIDNDNGKEMYDVVLKTLWDIYVRYCQAYGYDVRRVIGYTNPYHNDQWTEDYNCKCMDPVGVYGIHRVGLRHQGNCFYEAFFLMYKNIHIDDHMIEKIKSRIFLRYRSEMSEASKTHFTTLKHWADQESIIWVSRYFQVHICIHLYDSLGNILNHQTYEQPGASTTLHIACINNMEFETMASVNAVKSGFIFEYKKRESESTQRGHANIPKPVYTGHVENKSVIKFVKWANSKTLRWCFNLPWGQVRKAAIKIGQTVKDGTLGTVVSHKLDPIGSNKDSREVVTTMNNAVVFKHPTAMKYDIVDEVYNYIMSTNKSTVRENKNKEMEIKKNDEFISGFKDVIYGVPNVNYFKMNVSTTDTKKEHFNTEQFEEHRKEVDEVRHTVNSMPEKYWYTHCRNNKMSREEEQLWVSKGAYKMEELDFQFNLISWGTKHLFVAEGRGGFVQMLMTKIAEHRKAENHKIFLITSLRKERERPWINAMDIPQNVNYETIIAIDDDGGIIAQNDIQDLRVRKAVKNKITEAKVGLVDTVYFDGAESARNQHLASLWQEDIFVSLLELACSTLRRGGSMIVKLCDFFYNHKQIAVLMSCFSNHVFWRSPSSVNCTQEVYLIMRGFKQPSKLTYHKLQQTDNASTLKIGYKIADKLINDNPTSDFSQSLLQRLVGSQVTYSHWIKRDKCITSYTVPGANLVSSLAKLMSLSRAYSSLMKYELQNMLSGKQPLKSNHVVKPIASGKVKTYRYNKLYRTTNEWRRVTDCDGNMRPLAKCSLIPESRTREMIREFGCFSMKINGKHYQDRAYETWLNFVELYRFRVSETDGYEGVKHLKFMGKINLHNHFSKNNFMKLSYCGEIAEMFFGSDISNLPVGFADKTLEGWLECIKKKMDMYHTPQSAHDINSLMACLEAISNYDHKPFDLMPWDEIEKILNKKGAGGWLNDKKLIDIAISPEGRREVDKIVNDLINGVIPPCFMSVNHKTEVRALESDINEEGSWNPYPKPRAIQFYDGYTRLAHFRLFGYFQTMHNLDHKLYWGSNTGRSLTDVGDYLKEQWDKYKKPICIIGDTKTWDGNMTAEQLICECESFMPHLDKKLHKALQTFYEIDMAPLCLDLGGQLFFRKAQRGSGVWNTSRGNGKVNVALWVQMISEALGVIPSWVMENVTICCEGDDIVTIMEEQHAIIVLAYAAKFLKRVNKPPKLVDEDGNIRWTSKFTEIEFCSHTYKPVPIKGRVRFLPHRSLAELVGKFALTKKLIGTKFGTKEARELNRSKAISYLLLYPGQPILRRLALLVLTKTGWGTFDTKEFKYIFGSIVGATSLLSAVRSVYGSHIDDLSDIGYFPYGLIQKDYRNLMNYSGGNYDQNTNFKNLARDYVSTILNLTYNSSGIDEISIRRDFTGHDLVDVSFLSLDRYLLKTIVRDWRMTKFLIGLNKKLNLYPEITSVMVSDSKTEYLIKIFKVAFMPDNNEKIDSDFGDHVVKELNIERTRFSFSKGFSLDQFNIAMLTWANRREVEQNSKGLILLEKIRKAKTVLKLTNRVATWLGLRVSTNIMVSPT